MIHRYPRTPHIKGSGRSTGDDLDDVPFSELVGEHLIVEEKMDGANCAVSFDNGKLMLQSRGHYLVGGPREKQFDLFKVWVSTQATTLRNVLGERYVMFGEWMWAKHTCFYDMLPHYFLEFDILDKDTNTFLSTQRRDELISQAGARNIISSVKVLHEGELASLDELKVLIGRSSFKSTDWLETLRIVSGSVGIRFDDAIKHTDASSDVEGLYVKWEGSGIVRGRYKFVRKTFVDAIIEQNEHWLNRTMINNVLQEGADKRMFLQ